MPSTTTTQAKITLTPHNLCSYAEEIGKFIFFTLQVEESDSPKVTQEASKRGRSTTQVCWAIFWSCNHKAIPPLPKQKLVLAATISQWGDLTIIWVSVMGGRSWDKPKPTMVFMELSTWMSPMPRRNSLCKWPSKSAHHFKSLMENNSP